ncbi:MAG: YciI family protein [Aquisalinus sp.]|nr:YciI family protein [Aquisalinus sp.]
MQYMIVAAESEEDMAARKSTEPGAFEAYMGPWFKYSTEMQEAGVTLSGNALETPDTATCVRVRDGKRQVQDGPFADTKEQLGGYFIIDVPSFEATKEWAAKCPAAATGLVELRKVATLEEEK